MGQTLAIGTGEKGSRVRRGTSKLSSAGYSWYLLLLLAGFSTGTLEGSEADGQPRVEVLARGMFPGEVIRIEVTAEKTIQDLNGSVFGRVFPFERSHGASVWDGLVGIDLGVEPGSYEVRLGGHYVDGTPVLSDPISIEVQSKTFPTRKLTVDRQYVDPPPETLDRIRDESRRVSRILSTVKPERLWRGDFELPVPGKATSSFGKRSILNGQARSPHSGTDFEAAEGTPVKAPNSGIVALAENLYFAGNTVIVDHGQGLFSYFAHLSSFEVQDGDVVNQSQVIGRVGATGRVTGPHLHWAVRLVEARVDPLSLIEALSKREVNRSKESH